MDIEVKISQLRILMSEKKINAYIVPSADFHQSEYVGEHFKARAYLTGFTGSFGTAVVTMDKAALWTDGRYMIQAERQMSGNGIDLYCTEDPNVPTLLAFLMAELPENGKLGFDGRLLGFGEGESMVRKLAEKGISVNCDNDLIDMIWKDRPKLASNPVFLLKEEYSGEHTNSKLKRVRKAMEDAGATCHVLASLEDIAWLFNIRGSDVNYLPLVLCYALIFMDKVELFIDRSRLSEDVKSTLSESHIAIRPYNDIYDAVKQLGDKEAILMDPSRVNHSLSMNIPIQTKRIPCDNPSILMKAMKNAVELENIRNAHIKDGVACTKFIYWVKTNIGKVKITEISAQEKLEALRKDQKGYLWQSFAPICAFGENAAMMHYSATSDTDTELSMGHFFLSDTGGNYLEGTTDITRTMALGNVSTDLKRHFTAVVKGMINLSKARFLYGCRGYNLDVLARGPIWDMGLDYKCGTGHGVGYLLNIHEGPSGFRWYVIPSKHETHPLEEGMVLTNEPGIYVSGSHGIRIENEMIVKKGELNGNGQFMHLETITFAPIDLDGIIVEDLNSDEKLYLNSYHRKVYEKIAPHLSDEEREWLKVYTREI